MSFSWLLHIIFFFKLVKSVKRVYNILEENHAQNSIILINLSFQSIFISFFATCLILILALNTQLAEAAPKMSKVTVM